MTEVHRAIPHRYSNLLKVFEHLAEIALVRSKPHRSPLAFRQQQSNLTNAENGSASQASKEPAPYPLSLNLSDIEDLFFTRKLSARMLDPTPDTSAFAHSTKAP